MNPYKPNQGTQKAQEPLGQGDVPSHAGPKGSRSPPDANIRAGVIEAAFRVFMEVLDAVLIRASDEGRRHVARILRPRVRRLLAFLEGLCGDKPGETAESPCDPYLERKDGTAPCEHLKAHLKSPCEDELTGSAVVHTIRAPQPSLDQKDGTTKVEQDPRDAWITESEAAEFVGRNRGVVSRWVTQQKVVHNGQPGRKRRLLKSSIVLQHQELINKDRRKDQEELWNDRNGHRA